MPVSTLNQKFENLLPNELFPGTSSWLMFLEPIINAPVFSFAASMNK